MSKKNLIYLQQSVYLVFSIVIFTSTGSIWLTVIVYGAIQLLTQEILHVPDNSAYPLYFLNNFIRCVGPGYHFIPWPLVTWGNCIDTRSSQAECRVTNTHSADRISFKINIHFSYRFMPYLIKDRQLAQEIISGGSEGCRINAQQTALNAALYISRGFSHLQLLTGPQQALIQGQIAQETAQRLSSAGIVIIPSAFQVTFEGPKELESAFVQQQAARPNAQSTVIGMVEVLSTIQQFKTPEMQRYLDLLMVQAVGNQKTDPLSAMVAQEWFRRSRNWPGVGP